MRIKYKLIELNDELYEIFYECLRPYERFNKLEYNFDHFVRDYTSDERIIFYPTSAKNDALQTEWPYVGLLQMTSFKDACTIVQEVYKYADPSSPGIDAKADPTETAASKES